MEAVSIAGKSETLTLTTRFAVACGVQHRFFLDTDSRGNIEEKGSNHRYRPTRMPAPGVAWDPNACMAVHLWTGGQVTAQLFNSTLVDIVARHEHASPATDGQLHLEEAAQWAGAAACGERRTGRRVRIN